MRYFLKILFITSMAAGWMHGAPATPEQRAFIAAAVPASAPAKPAKTRRLLVYSETKGFRHKSIEVGVEAITLMGARTGAYAVFASEDPAVLGAESLRGFDAVLFLNITGSIFDQVEKQQVLLDFVKGGGGIAGIHSATDACYEWPEWGEMLGGWFDGHPWRWNSNVTIRIEEPGHPLNASFGGASSLEIQDEIYQLKGPDFRASHRVLSSLDPERTDMTLKGIKRADRDFPITMIREYGKGRVFYCSLGHNEHIYWNPAVLGHYLAGLQWVMGDLAVDASPHRAATGGAQTWEKLKTTGYAANPRELDWLDERVAEAGLDPVKLAELEARLLEVFKDPAATPAARQAAAQRLGSVLVGKGERGGSATLAEVGAALREAETADWARLALDPVPGAEVDALYVAALRDTTGKARLAAVQGAGERRIEAAVPLLASLLRDADLAAAKAAVWSLGQIGGNAALRALDSTPEHLAPAAVEARLALAARANARIAGRIYESIYGSAAYADQHRATALRGLIAVRPGSAVKHIQMTLSGNVVPFQQAALEAITHLPERDVVRQFARQLPVWAPEVQRAVIAAFGRRGDAAAVPVLLELLAAEDPDVRLEAIDALGRLSGSKEVVTRLAAIAEESGEAGKTAEAALARLDGRGIDGLMLERAQATGEAQRAMYIGMLARRGQTEAIPVLLAMRAEQESRVRQAALEALGDLAGPAERSALLAWALEASDPAEQNRAVRSLISEMLRDDDKAGRAEPVLAAMRAGGAKAQVALLPVLSRVAGEPARVLLQELAGGEDPAVAQAAVTQLGRWPDNEAVVPLVLAAEKAKDDGLRQSAVAAAVRLVEKERDAPNLDETDVLRRLLALPVDVEAKKDLLRVLGRAKDATAEELALRWAEDAELGGMARGVAEAIRSNREWPPAATASASDRDTWRIADGRVNTNWAIPAKAGGWLQVDLKHARPLAKLVLDAARGSEAPVELQVFVSDDPENWGEPRATFQGDAMRSVIELPAGVRGRYVRLVHTGSREEGNWSIAELAVE